MSMKTRTGRAKGQPNLKPSKAAVANYYRLLRSAAEDGDTTAAGWLVFLSERRQASRSTADYRR